MHCQECGKKVEENFQFCPFCGKKLIKPKICSNCGAKLKENFYQEVKQVLLQHLPKEKNVDIIAGVLVHRMYGLGFIDVIMSDDLLEELAINGS